MWKTFYDENREKHENIIINKYRCRGIDEYISKYTDIVNDKLELVNKTGELLNSIMVEVQNVVDMVRETDNDRLIYDILAENLKKWGSNILKLIKPNASGKKDKPNASEKKDEPNTSVKKDNLMQVRKKISLMLVLKKISLMLVIKR